MKRFRTQKPLCWPIFVPFQEDLSHDSAIEIVSTFCLRTSSCASRIVWSAGFPPPSQRLPGHHGSRQPAFSAATFARHSFDAVLIPSITARRLARPKSDFDRPNASHLRHPPCHGLQPRQIHRKHCRKTQTKRPLLPGRTQ